MRMKNMKKTAQNKKLRIDFEKYNNINYLVCVFILVVLIYYSYTKQNHNLMLISLSMLTFACLASIFVYGTPANAEIEEDKKLLTFTWSNIWKSKSEQFDLNNLISVNAKLEKWSEYSPPTTLTLNFKNKHVKSIYFSSAPNYSKFIGDKTKIPDQVILLIAEIKRVANIQ